MARQKSFARHVAEVSADEIERLKAALAASEQRGKPEQLTDNDAGEVLRLVHDLTVERDDLRAQLQASEQALKRVRVELNSGDSLYGDLRTRIAAALASPGSPQKRVK